MLKRFISKTNQNQSARIKPSRKKQRILREYKPMWKASVQIYVVITENRLSRADRFWRLRSTFKKNNLLVCLITWRCYCSMFQHEQTFVPKIKTCLHHPHVLIDINSPFCRTYISSSACFQCLIVDHSLMICWVFYNHAVCGGILFGFGQLLYLFTTLFDSLNLQVFNSGIALQRQLSEVQFCLFGQN